MKRCNSCKREWSPEAWRGGNRAMCYACFCGRARVGKLAQQRPHLWSLTREAREIFVSWETARLSFCRALRPLGVRVKWRGFQPVVTVVERRDDAE